jgi:hypothetical protein
VAALGADRLAKAHPQSGIPTLQSVCPCGRILLSPKRCQVCEAGAGGGLLWRKLRTSVGHRTSPEKCQRRKWPLCSITSSPPASTTLQLSFGQPGFSQSFFVSREVFGTPIRAHHVFESGNSQRGIQLPQPSHCLVCLLRPPGHCVACCGDT